MIELYRKRSLELYQKIREENKIFLNKRLNNIFNIVTEELYGSKTQMIFELLQNADDACTKLSSNRVKKYYEVFFNLKKDKLMFTHNGAIFDEDDVRGICDMGGGPKKEDEKLIGKFGIGFKSVYQYTKTPKIYCNDEKNGQTYNFYIDKLVLPYELSPSKEINCDQTLIEIPFNSLNKSSIEAYYELRSFIKNISVRSLLFLNNISKITWKDGMMQGYFHYSRLGEKSSEPFFWL